MSKFDELKKLAEAATKGPWRKGSCFTIGPVSKEDDQSYGMVIPVADVYGDNREADTALITAANPAAILELLAILAQLVGALKDFDAAVSNLSGFGMRKDRERLVTCLVAARCAVAAVEAQP